MHVSILTDAAFTPQEGTQQNPSKQGELLGPPSSHQRKYAPTLHSGLISAREGSGNASPDCSRVIYAISQSGGRLNPTLEPTGSLLPEREVPRQEPQLSDVPKDHKPIDLFLTMPAPGQVPPGVSPAPHSAQSWGRARWAVALAFGPRLLTLAGYRSHNVSECQSGLSFDHCYNQIQHFSMDY